MMYAIGILVCVFIACAMVIFRQSSEIEELAAAISVLESDLHYLRARNRELNAELLTMNRTVLYEDRIAAIADLPAEHPQKRKRKTIRKKAP